MWNWSENQIKLTLIRHGATKGNEEKRYISFTEEKLSEQGIRQLLEYKKIYGDLNPDEVIVSPRKRCIQTAEILFDRKSYDSNMKSGEKYSLSEYETLTEMNFGEFEGCNYLDLSENMDYRTWVDSNCTSKIPGGESREEFCARVWNCFVKIIKSTLGDDKHNLVFVVHGGTIMAILERLTDLEYFDFYCKNGEGYQGTLYYDKVEEKLKIQELHKIFVREET